MAVDDALLISLFPFHFSDTKSKELKFRLAIPSSISSTGAGGTKPFQSLKHACFSVQPYLVPYLHQGTRERDRKRRHTSAFHASSAAPRLWLECSSVHPSGTGKRWPNAARDLFAQGSPIGLVSFSNSLHPSPS